MLIFLLAVLVALVPALLIALLPAPSSVQRAATRSTPRKYPQFFRNAFLLAAAWIWVNGTGALSPLYERLLHVDWPVVPNTVSNKPAIIVLLGGGTERSGPHGTLRPFGDSIEKVALTGVLYHRLNNAGISTRVIISGGDPLHHGASEADTYAPDLESLGVPADKVILENQSLNTYQNAANVARILGDTRADQMILVTTGLHMHRSLLDFRRFGMFPVPAAVPLPPVRYSLLPNPIALERANAAWHELIGIAQFHVYRAVHLF